MTVLDVAQLLTEVDSTAICDVDKSTRVMTSAIACRSANPMVCGPAFTVRCRDDFFGLVLAIEEAIPGDVLVVDGGGQEVAYAGELLARAAAAKGLAGIIVDGGYRDLAYVAGCDFPVYSRYVTPMAGTTKSLGELRVPVTCGGVVVRPGDIIVADREGVIVLDPERVADLVASAREVKRHEARVLARLNEGASLADCLNVAEHRELLSQGQESALHFTV